MEETCPARRGGGRGHCGGRGTDAPGWQCDGARPGRPDHLLPDRDEPQHRTAMRDEFGQLRSLPSTLSSCQAQKAIDWGMGTIKVDGKALTGNQRCDVVAFPYVRGPRWESEMDRFASVELVMLMPRTSDDPEKAIQPVRTKLLVTTSHTMAGLKRESITAIAGFPCEAVTVV